MKSLKIYHLPLLVVLAATVAIAQPRPQRLMHDAPRLMHEKLNLTPDQEKKIDELRTEHQKKMVDLRATMEKLHLEKKEMVSKGNYDRKSFLALEDKIQKQRDVIESARANHQMDVYELLDQNQKEIWNKRPMVGPKGKMQRPGRGHRGCSNCDGPGMGPKF